jgi:hypothetical protein
VLNGRGGWRQNGAKGTDGRAQHLPRKWLLDPCHTPQLVPGDHPGCCPILGQMAERKLDNLRIMLHVRE